MWRAIQLHLEADISITHIECGLVALVERNDQPLQSPLGLCRKERTDIGIDGKSHNRGAKSFVRY